MDEKPKKEPKPKTPKKNIPRKPSAKEILQELLGEQINDSIDHNREVQDLSKALIGTLSEFLTCFNLMGYDFDGNPVVISFSKNDMHYDALNSLLLRFFAYTTQKMNKPSPPDNYD